MVEFESPMFKGKLRREIEILKILLRRRLYIDPKLEKNIVNQFHKLYYDSFFLNKTWSDTKWLGVKTQKLPLDLWIYQEIIYELKPDLIIETGTASGGSALYLASICDLINHGKIVTIDILKEKNRPKHKRIRYITGSSTSTEVKKYLSRIIQKSKKVMAILDSDHHKSHVLKELEIYSKFVTKGQYLIIEDTNLNGHPVDPDFGSGPGEAVNEFLSINKSFTLDKSKEKFYLTFNPGGYFKKTSK